MLEKPYICPSPAIQVGKLHLKSYDCIYNWKKVFKRLKVYLLYSKGPDDILWQQLSLYQCHLDVSVDLRIIRPVLTALHLRVTKPSVWHNIFTSCMLTAMNLYSQCFTAHIHIRISASCQAIIFSNKDNCHITLAPICHLIFQRLKHFFQIKMRFASY